MVLGFWELAETSEVAENFIRGALVIVKLVVEGEKSKKYLGASHPQLKDNNLKQPNKQRPKCQKIKNGHNSSI